MKYRIEIADDASAEAEDAYLWMMEQLSKERAEKWFDGLMDAIDTLSNSPKRCSVAPENVDSSEEIRQLLYGKGRGTYRILFTVSESIVYVLHIRHASRQFLEL